MLARSMEATVPARIPLNDLKRHNGAIAADLDRAIGRVLSRGWYILGPEVEAFEQEFAAFCHSRFCVSTGNGTDALELALRALDVGPGHRVATVANAGLYATSAIAAAGAVPRYVDIDPATMLMDPASLQPILDRGVEAVMVTHLYGRVADLPEILRLTAAAGVPVIEDCAHAHGASLHGRPAGSWGAIGCFSFYPTKNLGALGDGGAAVTSDPELAARLRLGRQYGWEGKYRSSGPGRNSRLDELQAAVLRAKLPHLPRWNARRLAIAAAYGEGLAGCGLQLPPASVPHLYVVRTPFRDDLQAELARAGVATDVHYPVPDHRQPWVAGTAAGHVELPETERCCREILTLPCFPEMTDSEVSRVVSSVQLAMPARSTA
jgi:dTDP-4-amino-4,6-dideoxygalactose transaminase